MDLRNYINSYKDFPKKWIDFKDISPILWNNNALNFVINSFEVMSWNPTKIVWLDARWFIFWSLLANKMWLPFVMIRKKWKLPWECECISYDLEYWTNEFEIQKDSIKKGDKIVLVDDLLATWWSVKAWVELIERLWWEVTCINTVIELEALGARSMISDYKINSLLKY